MTEPELKEFLIQWQIWSKSDVDLLGFNKTSPIYNLQRGTIQITGSQVIESEICERLDHAISIMPDNLQKFIVFKYLYKWQDKEACAKFRISSAAYKNQTRLSRMWLTGYLSKKIKQE